MDDKHRRDFWGWFELFPWNLKLRSSTYTTKWHLHSPHNIECNETLFEDFKWRVPWILHLHTPQVYNWFDFGTHTKSMKKWMPWIIIRQMYNWFKIPIQCKESQLTSVVPSRKPCFKFIHDCCLETWITKCACVCLAIRGFQMMYSALQGVAFCILYK